MQYYKSLWYRLDTLNQRHLDKDLVSFQVQEDEYLQLLKEDLRKLLSQIRRPTEIISNNISHYGLEDLGLYDPLSENDKEDVRLAIQHTIEEFEPRLHNVLVTPIAADIPQIDYMQFKIYAEVSLVPAKKLIVFDSFIATANGTISIELNEGEANV